MLRSMRSRSLYSEIPGPWASAYMCELIMVRIVESAYPVRRRTSQTGVDYEAVGGSRLIPVLFPVRMPSSTRA